LKLNKALLLIQHGWVRESMLIKKLIVMASIMIAPSLCIAESETGLSLSLLTSYSQSASSLEVDGRSASFRTGGAGLKLDFDTRDVGSFYASAGGGYLPKQSASFAGVVLSGPADSVFYGAGYSYNYALNDRLALSLIADYVSYDINGDLKGEAFSMPVRADIESRVTMLDTSAALRLTMSPNVKAVLGAGTKRWTLDAEADGVIGDSIAASTSVNAYSTDPQFYLGVEFTISNVPVDIYYHRTTLEADNSVALNGVDIRVLLMQF